MHLQKRCVRGPAQGPGELLPTCCIALKPPSSYVVFSGYVLFGPPKVTVADPLCSYQPLKNPAGVTNGQGCVEIPRQQN